MTLCVRYLSVRALFVCFILALSSIVPFPIQAQPADTMEEVVVTATRTPTDKRLLGSAATVIDREEIENQQSVHLSDLLRSVPGVAIDRAGSFGGQTFARIRGIDAKYTQVLIDGVKVNDPSGVDGQYDLSTLTTDDIERIEIVRGSQSIMYGSDAIGGVIHIITREGQDETEVRGQLENGSFDSRRQAGGISGREDRLSYNVNYSRFETDGVSAADEDDGNTEADGYENRTFSSNLSLDLRDDWQLSSSLRYTEAITETDGFGPVDADQSQDMTQTTGRIKLGGSLLTEAWTHEASFHWLDQKRIEKTTSTTHNVAERQRWNYETGYRLNEHHQLTASVQTFEDVARTSSLDTGFRTDVYAGEYRWNPNNDMQVTLGARLDDHEKFGDHPTYRGSVAYFTDLLTLILPGETTKLKGMYGTGFNAPSIYQLSVSSLFAVGNPDLEPEESNGWDVGFEHHFSDVSQLDVTYFQNEIEDEIQFRSGNPAGEPDYFNQDGITEAEGIETTLRLQLTPASDIHLTYTYQKSEDTGGNDIRRIPEKKGSVDWNLRWNDRLQFNVHGQYTDERPDGGVILDEYVLWNLRARYQLGEQAEFFGRVENATDEDYQDVDGFGTPGRGLYGGFRARF